jgi:hypothetical protein
MIGWLASMRPPRSYETQNSTVKKDCLRVLLLKEIRLMGKNLLHTIRKSLQFFNGFIEF